LTIGSNLARESNICFESQISIIHRRTLLRPARRMLELRLIHMFTCVSGTLAGAYPEGHHVNSSIENIFQLAGDPRHWYMMDILLGCTALSLRVQNPHDQILVEASHSYALRAIQECSRQIKNGVDASNAECLFATSLFIAMHAFTNRQFDLQDDSAITGQLPLLTWLRQFQGVKAIRNAGWSHIRGSSRLQSMVKALPAAIIIPNPPHEPFFDYLLEGLDTEGATEEAAATYIIPVAYLNSVMSNPTRQGLLGFPVSISARFLELIESQDPRALTIIGSYLAFVRLSRRSAYLAGAAERDFNSIVAHLPEEWLPRLDWARNVFALDIAPEYGHYHMRSGPGIVNIPTFSL